MLSVTGQASLKRAPERAGVTVTVRAEGAERADVLARVQALAERLTGELGELEASGAVDEWSSERVSAWANHPWNDAGERLPLVHYASMPVTAVFADFAALEEWLSPVLGLDEVAVSGPWWTLSEETRAEVERQASREAIEAARAKAEDFAAAIGKASVEPVEISDDPDAHFGGGVGGGPMMMAASARFAMDDGVGAQVSFSPSDVEVAVAVKARYRAV